jgi:hypothetical protein
MKLGDQQCGSFLKERRLWKRESVSPTLPHLLEGRDPSFPTLQSFLHHSKTSNCQTLSWGVVYLLWRESDMIQILRGITNGFTELDSLLIWIISSNHTVIVNGILRVSLLQYYGHVLWGTHYSTKWSLHLDGWRSSSIGGSTPLTVSYHSNFLRLKIGFSWLLRIHQPFHGTRDFFNFYESKEFRLASLTSIVNRVWSVNS